MALDSLEAAPQGCSPTFNILLEHIRMAWHNVCPENRSNSRITDSIIACKPCTRIMAMVRLDAYVHEYSETQKRFDLLIDAHGHCT